MWEVSWPGVCCYKMDSGSGGSAGARRQYGHMHWGYASMQPGVSQEAASTYCWNDHSSHAILHPLNAAPCTLSVIFLGGHVKGGGMRFDLLLE